LNYRTKQDRASTGSALGVLLLVGIAGCTLEEVDSDAIRTQGMYADVLAIAPGDGTTLVRVDLTVGGASGTKVHLVGEDALVAEAGDALEGLSRRARGRYEALLAGDAPGTISVRLERGPDDDTAGGSAELPEPFAMQLATDDSVGINRSTPVVAQWDPGVDGGSIDWAVEGRCVWADSGTTPDDGELTLGPEHVRVRPTRTGDDCEVQLTLERGAQGDVDPQLEPGSRFRALQRRGVTFVSTPALNETGSSALPEAPAVDAGS
jgi:hypothetical protein